jgi:hypothetical protein
MGAVKKADVLVMPHKGISGMKSSFTMKLKYDCLTFIISTAFFNKMIIGRRNNINELSWITN